MAAVTIHSDFGYCWRWVTQLWITNHTVTHREGILPLTLASSASYSYSLSSLGFRKKDREGHA